MPAPRQVLIAPDSFKECLSSREAAEAIAAGIADEFPETQLDLCPVADGGEGTVEALVTATRGEYRQVEVEGPLGNPVCARYGLLADGTAVIEMAAASGLALVPAGRRDVMAASTFGTGQLLEAAREAGARQIILGIGGSATVDGGAGALSALGFRLTDLKGDSLARGGGALEHLEQIEPAGTPERWAGIRVCIACDVDNPLLGPQGAAAVFGPQKGATPQQVPLLDAGLARLAGCLSTALGADIAAIPGGGAAGGLGAGLMAGIGATLESGAQRVFEVVDLTARLARADLVITGEGAIDGTSARGKLIGTMVQHCRAAGTPVVALVGKLGPGWETLLEDGLTAAFSLAPGPDDLENLMRETAVHLRRQARQAVRLFSV